MFIKELAVASALACLLGGCVVPGQSAYLNDPFTGGIDASSSKLLNIPLPGGLQYYPSHSKISGGGRKEGLEMWRGYVDPEAAAANLYANLKQDGWQIRMLEKAASRAIYIYQRSSELAAIVFQKQGMLTVMQIWAGPRLADGTTLASPAEEQDMDGVNSMPAEEYSPADKNAPAEEDKGKVETWGVQEREL